MDQVILHADQSPDSAGQACPAPGGSWANAAHASGYFGPFGTSVSVDLAGNSYVTGEFEDSGMFGATTHNSKGKLDIFVAKLDPSGKFLWAKSGGRAVDHGAGIAVDKSGNSYVTGSFSYLGDATFGSIKANGNGISNIFVAKVDTKGNYLWVKSAGGANRRNYGRGIVRDCAGNIYVTGDFGGSGSFGPAYLTSILGYSVFVWKLGAGSL